MPSFTPGKDEEGTKLRDTDARTIKEGDEQRFWTFSVELSR